MNKENVRSCAFVCARGCVYMRMGVYTETHNGLTFNHYEEGNKQGVVWVVNNYLEVKNMD